MRLAGLIFLFVGVAVVLMSGIYIVQDSSDIANAQVSTADESHGSLEAADQATQTGFTLMSIAPYLIGLLLVVGILVSLFITVVR